MDVISPVTEPSPWCLGMVVVPKPSGICMDLKKLNECVQREFHPLPHVEEILAQLTGAQVFTKLDTNSGSHLPENHVYSLHLSLPSGDTVLTNRPLALQVPRNYFNVV